MAEENAQLKKVQSLYVHVPFCRHLCNYCDFYKRVPDSIQDYRAYEKLLNDSLQVQNKLFKEHGYTWDELESLYLGGGTPSLWGKDGASALKELLSSDGIILSEKTEFTLEVNPGSWNDEGLKAWQELGVNRFSLGIQSLDSYYLKTLDRIHSLKDVHETLKKFQSMNANFSVDFMLGLPFSKEGKRDIIAELTNILEYNPSHISLYILTTKKHYIHREHLPDDTWVEDEFLKVSEFLRGKGFAHYEVSNFALPGKESQHNMRYWRSETVAALGPSATGFLSEERLRYKWKTTEAKFEEELLSEDEYKLEELYMGLRTHQGVNLESFFPKEATIQIVENWKKAGYLSQISPRIMLSPRGYLMLDSLLDDLFKLN